MVMSVKRMSIVGRYVFALTGTFSSASSVSRPSMTLKTRTGAIEDVSDRKWREDSLAEHGVLAVQMRLFGVCDEELRGV